MKKSLLYILLISLCLNLVAQQNNDSILEEKENQKIQTQTSFKTNQELEFQIKLLESKLDSIKDNNSQQLDFYKENQSTIFWMVSIFIGILGGAFVLFTYLFKRPDEILKKIKDSENQSKEIIQEAKFLLQRLDFQYEHQESIFILNNKSLYNYTENDWSLVEVYANKAKEVVAGKRTANDWIFIGLSAFRKIKIKESISAFEEATKINPEYEIAWKHLGNAYDKDSKFDKAIDAFNKVIDINPNNDVAFNNLGIEHIAIGKFKEAERYFLKSIRLNPNNCFAYTNYFESCLVNEVRFDKKLVTVFEEKFNDNTEAMASYDMLIIYKRIISEEDIKLESELESWKIKYKSVAWDESYRDIENWIDTKQDETKLKLMKALNVFSSNSAFKNYA
ncbi:tetratricopeptide repeat protein [Winogradskyella sp. A2]|uniref:tetratricopeptide repeat protein n=1 Tax=Winogradskyella sp. A2 TaxID=3366944 RepID=UPI00398C3074